MGLFDSLKKIGQDLEKEIEKNVGSDALRSFKDAALNSNDLGSNGIFSNNRNSKEIPAEYSEFPKFRENAEYLTTTETNKYIRCTMDYPNATDGEISGYISKINSLGYIRGSNVRFDNGNKYIIVDTENGGLHLVFHIKR